LVGDRANTKRPPISLTPAFDSSPPRKQAGAERGETTGRGETGEIPEIVRGVLVGDVAGEII
jgi:hypothetical protein